VEDSECGGKVWWQDSELVGEVLLPGVYSSFCSRSASCPVPINLLPSIHLLSVGLKFFDSGLHDHHKEWNGHRSLVSMAIWVILRMRTTRAFKSGSGEKLRQELAVLVDFAA
jgi:hypothetical protein